MSYGYKREGVEFMPFRKQSLSVEGEGEESDSSGDVLEPVALLIMLFTLTRLSKVS